MAQATGPKITPSYALAGRSHSVHDAKNAATAGGGPKIVQAWWLTPPAKVPCASGTPIPRYLFLKDFGAGAVFHS